MKKPVSEKQLNAAVEVVVKDSLKHFRRDGWDLDYGMLNDQVYDQLLPDGYSLKIWQAMLPRGYCFKVKDGRLVLGKSPKTLKKRRLK